LALADNGGDVRFMEYACSEANLIFYSICPAPGLRTPDLLDWMNIRAPLVLGARWAVDGTVHRAAPAKVSAKR
jgi:hypothetical protein